MSTITAPTTTSGRPELEGLLKLINSATHDAMAIYEESGHGVPSINSPDPHPLDTKAATRALKTAIRVLEGACEQLCTTIAPPGHILANRSQVHYDCANLRVAVEYCIPDIIGRDPAGLSITQLAEKTGIHSKKLRKVMRALATRHCFRQVGPDSFANNRLSRTLGDPEIGSCVNLCTGMQEASVVLTDTLKDPEFGPSFDPTKSPYVYFHRHEDFEGGYFDHIALHPRLQEIFSSAMLGWAKMTDDGSLVHDFPWKDMPAGTTFCDIGGGVGSVSIRLVKAHAHIKITLQDLPNVIEDARAIWDKECPQAVLDQRVSFVAFDFLKGSPVGGQNVYYLRHILHDWPDDVSVTILQNVRKVMSVDSRVFIHEYALQPPYLEESIPNAAPEPLLPNYGAGNIRHFNQDLNLFCVANAGERTIDEFISIGERAGLKFVRAWEFAENSMLEFRLA